MGVALAGTVLLFLGWFGASGRATIAEQVPFIASGSIPGAALLIAGAVLVASDLTRHSNERVEQLITQLHALLVEEASDRTAVAADETADAPAPPRPDDELVALDGTTHVHRVSCALVRGKAAARPIGADEAARLGLRPCPVCEP